MQWNRGHLFAVNRNLWRARGNLTLAIFAKGFAHPFPLPGLLLGAGGWGLVEDCAIECQNAHKLRKCRSSAKKRSQRKRQAEGSRAALWGGAAFSLLVTLGSVFVLAAEPLSRAYKIHTLHFSRLPTRLDGCHAPAQPSSFYFLFFFFFWVTHGETFCQMQFTSVCFIAGSTKCLP